MKQQIHIYGSQTLVNLVDQHGREKHVKEAFERVVGDLGTDPSLGPIVSQVRYKYFDFHTECKNMKWEKVGDLITSIQDDLIKEG